MFLPMIRSVKTKQVHKTEFCCYLKTVQKKKERHIIDKLSFNIFIQSNKNLLLRFYVLQLFFTLFSSPVPDLV